MKALINKDIIDAIVNYNIEIIVALSIGFFVLIILNIISQMRISKIKTEYNKLVMGSDSGNLEEILLEVGKDMDSISNNINVVERDLEILEEKFAFAIQKVGVVRFNAFEDLGSEQSFSIALLDEENTGFVFTSIYGRDYSSNYVKPIVKGEAEYKLSVEEIQAMDRANRQGN